MSNKRERYVVRLLMLGDSGAGKSTLLLRYVQDGFESEHMPTIGIDFRLKNIELDGKKIKVQVWDTAGQERFRTITHNYYRGAHGILLLYDVTKQATFLNIRKWIQDVRAYAEQNVNLVLIGNKCDLIKKKVLVCFLPSKPDHCNSTREGYIFNNKIHYYAYPIHIPIMCVCKGCIHGAS